ncbi:hypothetical protein D3C81_1309500 [compost metagenome]
MDMGIFPTELLFGELLIGFFEKGFAAVPGGESTVDAFTGEQADAGRVSRIEFRGLGLVTDIDFCACATGESDREEQEERGLHYSFP